MKYHEFFEETVAGQYKNKPKLMLHSCCAVCSSSVIALVADVFDTTVLYYNPNISPESEYQKRKNEQIRIINEIYGGKVKYLDFGYNHGEFSDKVKGLEKEPEGGARCEVCFSLRLQKTANAAKERGFDWFCTTLTVSPHKNADVINAVGKEISEKTGVPWLFSDFKKKNGYLRSITLTRQYSIYKQNYCGCEFCTKGEEQQ